MADPAEQRLAALRKRWEADRSSAAFVPLAEEYRRLGMLAEAVAVLEQGMKAAPNYLSARIALGRCRLDLGDTAGASAILEQVVHQDPTQLVASKLLVEAYLRSHRPEQARERLNLYAVLNDRDPELEEFRRRVQQEIRDQAESAPKPVADAELDDTGPVNTAPAPAQPGTVSASGEADAMPAEPAPAHGGATTRAPGDVFRLPALPRPELGAFAALPKSSPVRRGTVFGGLGTSDDRRRYVLALVHGGVFGVAAPPPADESVLEMVAPEEYTWDAVAIEPRAPVEPAGEQVASVEPPASVDTAGPVGIAEAAAEPLEAPAPQPVETIQPTATLGELYLSQGHPQEARTIFERVLEAQPDNPAARDGLENVRRQGESAGRSGLTARKVAVLRDYLKRVRGGSEQHVS